jgi:hypothetical protein
LIRRRHFAAAEWAQKYKPVPDEHGAENLRDLLERKPELHMVLPRSVASAVVEHDGGEGTATCGPPQRGFQVKPTTQDLDGVLLWRFANLCESRI